MYFYFGTTFTSPTYVSIPPGIVLRCPGCRRRAWGQGSPPGPSACQSRGAPGPARQWASRPRPEPASSQAGQWLPTEGPTSNGLNNGSRMDD